VEGGRNYLLNEARLIGPHSGRWAEAMINHCGPIGFRAIFGLLARQPLAYWRSTSGLEVDFILGDHTAIEVKAKAVVSTSDLKGLRALAEESLSRRYVCVCLAPFLRS
jgi:hypothetical protein